MKKKLIELIENQDDKRLIRLLYHLVKAAIKKSSF